MTAATPLRAQTSSGGTFTSAIVTYGTSPDSLYVNPQIGAQTFYDNGFTGTNAIVANIEGGYFWTGHDALNSNVSLLPVGGSGANAGSGQFDEHPTEVADDIAGRPLYAGDPRQGIAYGATLWGGAIATSISGENFNVSDASFFTPYAEALLTGYNGQIADVTNSSFTYYDPPPSSDPSNSGTGTGVSGADSYTVAVDGIAAESGRTMVFAAGNYGWQNDSVNDPAAGYNTISVGSLAWNSDAQIWNLSSSFSSAGPGDYQGPVNPSTPGGTVTSDLKLSAVRAVVDIVAPGEKLSLAEYGTGTDPTAFTGAVGGTSFAAPMVAGAATLLCDVGNTNYGGGESIQANVIKAVLMNSADHDDMGAYDNGQHTVNGVLTTSQALDYRYGTGALDLTTAYTQYTGGNTGIIGSGGGADLAGTGWDYATVARNGYNDYAFSGPLVGGTQFTATLTWMVDRTYAGLTDAGALATTPILDGSGDLIADPNDLGFVNLDLELFQVGSDGSLTLVALSDAQYINTQHFFFDVPETGDYVLRVLWAGENYDINDNIENQNYGIAWSGIAEDAGPEPSSLVLAFWAGGCAVIGGIYCGRRRARNARRP